MDWTVNDELYQCFLKWRLKCENILECELVALPEKQKCKKVIDWSVDFGMDQHVSWSLAKEDLYLDTPWDRFEEFCKPQSNEVRAHFDMLTSFCQGNKSMNEWYNAVQAQVNLAKYPPEIAKILHHDIFWFFMKDEDFVSRTINEGSIDLDKFPASKVCQHTKKMDSSKATARHIRQVAGDLQATQINFMHHQCTELSSGKKKRTQGVKQRQSHHKNAEHPASGQLKRNFDPKLAHKYKDRCPRCGDSAHLEGFQCPAKTFQCKACHFTSLCFQKNQQKQAPYKSRKLKANQLKAGALYVQDNSISGQSEDSSSDDSFCLQLKIQCTQASIKKVPTHAHLIANLAYQLKSHHNRNLYLRARLDTCADVNIMPASVLQIEVQGPSDEKACPK